LSVRLHHRLADGHLAVAADGDFPVAPNGKDRGRPHAREWVGHARKIAGARRSPRRTATGSLGVRAVPRNVSMRGVSLLGSAAKCATIRNNGAEVSPVGICAKEQEERSRDHSDDRVAPRVATRERRGHAKYAETDERLAPSASFDAGSAATLV